MSYNEDMLPIDDLIERGPYTETMPYQGDCYGNNYWTCAPETEPGITIQQYAEQHCVSYEAARRQVKRYRHLLIPHIRKIYNTQFLDDQAVELLESHLRPSSQPEDTSQVRNQIKKLSEDIEENRINLKAVQDLNQIIGSLKSDKEHLQDMVKKLEASLTESQNSYKKLAEHCHTLETELVSSRKEISHQKESIQQLNRIIADLEEKSEMLKLFQRILERQVNYYRNIIEGKEPEDPFRNLTLSDDDEE